METPNQQDGTRASRTSESDESFLGSKTPYEFVVDRVTTVSRGVSHFSPTDCGKFGYSRPTILPADEPDDEILLADAREVPSVYGLRVSDSSEYWFGGDKNKPTAAYAGGPRHPVYRVTNVTFRCGGSLTRKSVELVTVDMVVNPDDVNYANCRDFFSEPFGRRLATKPVTNEIQSDQALLTEDIQRTLSDLYDPLLND